jgi:hypothetical protein
MSDPSGHPRWDGERTVPYGHTAAFAFADALLALEEIDRQDIVGRLRMRWPEVNTDERNYP